ncbi:MAG: AraC family transcriptional regulator [Nevskiaceae bacterium]|nr:MAG: AraC family transcriptional regulator [Nevskiaceae bacterium]
MVRASGLRGYVTLMQRLGADAHHMLRRYRIAPEALNDDEALLRLSSVVHLLEASAGVTQCPDFGLRLADIQDISVLGPVAIAMQNAPTVAAALETASRYLFVHSPGMSLTIHPRSSLERGAIEMRFELHVASHIARRQTLDVCLGDLYHMVQLLAGTRHGLLAVALPHKPAAPLSTYRRFFGAPIHVEQPHAGLHIARSIFERNLQGGNHALRKIAVDYLALTFGNPEQTVAVRVRHALQQTLGTGQSGKSDIAGLLGMHPRTLQRHLSAENTSFEQLRDAIQKEMAARYLRQTRMPLSQLAGLLGYSEQAVLTRACRRWFEAPPSAVRRRAAAGRA